MSIQKSTLTRTSGLRQPIPLRGNTGGRLYGWRQRKGPWGTCIWNISVLYTKSTWGVATRSLGRLQSPQSSHSPRIAIFAIWNFTLEVVENCLNAFECFVLRSSKEAWHGTTFQLCRSDGAKLFARWLMLWPTVPSNWLRSQIPELFFHIVFCFL